MLEIDLTLTANYALLGSGGRADGLWSSRCQKRTGKDNKLSKLLQSLRPKHKHKVRTEVPAKHGTASLSEQTPHSGSKRKAPSLGAPCGDPETPDTAVLIPRVPCASYLSGSSSAMKFSTDTAVCFSWIAPVLRRLSMRSWAP